jgi:hypothetical protein
MSSESAAYPKANDVANPKHTLTMKLLRFRDPFELTMPFLPHLSSYAETG